MAINKHGIEMKGLKKASGETKDYGAYGSLYNEIFYELETGEVWVTTMTRNSWTQPVKGNISICDTHYHMTMQEIADKIHETLYLKKLGEEVLEAEIKEIEDALSKEAKDV